MSYQVLTFTYKIGDSGVTQSDDGSGDTPAAQVTVIVGS